jgi:alcohol-forming fatty acyl-CoA reductase
VHISSAYVNAYMLDVEEKLYPCHEKAEKLIDLINTLSDDALDELTPK